MPDVRSRLPARVRTASRGWLLPALAPLVVFWQGLVATRLLAPGDGYNYYLPLHVHAARLWRSGAVPVWNSLSFAGSPLLALNQPAVFYPPNLLFLILPAATANNLVVILNYVVAGVGAYLLGRRLTGDTVAAGVAGVAFGMSGFMFGHLGHQAIIASASWLPWTILGLEMLIERISPLRLLGAGAALALAVVAGHGQMFAINVFALAVYGAARAAGDRQLRPLVAVGVMLAVGVALSAVQLLPTALILDETDRSRLSFEEATSFSFSDESGTASHLPLLLFPYLFGNIVNLGPFPAPYRGEWALTELAGYMGAAALVLAVAGTAMAVRRDRRVAALVVTGVAALVVAVGDATPVSEIVYDLPVFGQFRNWGRFVVIVDLAVAVLAGVGVAHLRSRSSAERRRAATFAAAAGLAVLVTAAVVTQIPAVAEHAVEGRPRLWALAVPAAFAALAAGGALAAIRLRRGATATLAGIVALDMVLSFGLFYEWRAEWRTIEQLEVDLETAHPDFGPVPDEPGGIDRYMVGGVDVSAVPDYVNISLLHEQPAANGFDPLGPQRYLDAAGGMLYYGGVTRPEDLWREGSDILDLLRVTLVLAQTGTPEADALPAPTRSPEPAKVVRSPRRPGLPEAFVVGAAQREAPAEIDAAIAGKLPFDPTATALIDERCDPCEALDEPGRAGEASLRRPRDGRLVADVRADRPGLLVLSEGFFPGWSATVDGSSVPVVRANSVVLGVPVPAGSSTVELAYRAPGLRAGAAVSSVTAVGLAAAVIIAGRRRRRPSR